MTTFIDPPDGVRCRVERVSRRADVAALVTLASRVAMPSPGVDWTLLAAEQVVPHHGREINKAIRALRGGPSSSVNVDAARRFLVLNVAARLDALAAG
jgi:hypothetical protein